MGRGRKGAVDQGNKKLKKASRLPPKEERNVIIAGMKAPDNQTIVYLPGEVLNELRQLNPRDIVNIIVNL